MLSTISVVVRIDIAEGMELNTSGASNCSSENKYFLYSSIDRTLDTHAAFGTEHKRVKASLKPERRRGRDGEVGAEAGGAEGGGHGDDDVDVFLYCQHIVLLSGDATLMHVGCMCSQQYSFVAGSAWLRPFSMIHMLYLIPYTWGSNVDMVTSNFDMVTCNPHHTLTTPLRFSPAVLPHCMTKKFYLSMHP